MAEDSATGSDDTGDDGASASFPSSGFGGLEGTVRGTLERFPMRQSKCSGDGTGEVNAKHRSSRTAHIYQRECATWWDVPSSDVHKDGCAILLTVFGQKSTSMTGGSVSGAHRIQHVHH
jgi:hypothetical protein